MVKWLKLEKLEIVHRVKCCPYTVKTTTICTRIFLHLPQPCTLRTAPLMDVPIMLLYLIIMWYTCICNRKVSSMNTRCTSPWSNKIQQPADHQKAFTSVSEYTASVRLMRCVFLLMSYYYHYHFKSYIFSLTPFNLG